jgi:two-component system sensor histidine kinase/response regulator
VNDLLDISKIQAGKLELVQSDLSLRALLSQTLRALSVRAHKKGLELASHVAADVPDALVGDAGRLRQILLNLVGNAIKFTDRGEVVLRVRLHEDGPDGPMLVFEVVDTGIGIAPHRQRLIFEAFEQGDRLTSSRYGGTGLGLSIASQLVGMMGGRIDVASEPGKGSTFRFTARFGRRQDEAVERPATGAAAAPDLRGVRVMIVDGNATSRAALEESFRNWHAEVKGFDEPSTVYHVLLRAALAGRPYGLVMLDSRMPGFNSVAFAAMASRVRALAGSKIVLMTPDVRLRPGPGIAGIIARPIVPEELLNALNRVLGRPLPHPALPPPQQPTTTTAETRGPDGDAPPDVPETDDASRTRRLRILLAEDNEFNQDVIRHLLQSRGHSVTIVDDGRRALPLVTAEHYDALLLDCHMPQMDGFQVIAAIRDSERNTSRHLPVIALTAMSMKGDRERCLRAGMDAYLPKPVRAQELFAALDRLAMREPEAAAAASASATAPHHGPLLDAATLLASCGGDPRMLQSMVLSFESHARSHAYTVQAAIAAGDAALLEQSAHKLRGLVSAFSTVVDDAVAVLEAIGASRSLDDAAGAAEKCAAVLAMISELSALLAHCTVDDLYHQVAATA